MDTTPAPSPPPRRLPLTARVRFGYAVPVVLLFVIYATIVAVRGVQNDRVAGDQNLFHLPVIRQFTAQWPRPDLTNYASATAPGYHLVLGAVAKYVDDRVDTLRVFGGLFGIGLIALLACASSARSSLLVLPVVTSVYVLTSTVWLLPENAGWLLVAIALLLAMYAQGRLLFVGSGVTLALLVFVRQSHAWAFLPFTVAALYGPFTVHADRTLFATIFLLETDRPAAGRDFLRTGLLAVLSLLPALAILGWLVWLWHGLTPPAFRPGSGIELPLATKVGGFAPAAPAMVLSLLGLFGVPLLAWLLPQTNARRILLWALVGMAVGLVLGVVPKSTYSFERKSGIWNIVRMLPTFAGRSPVIVGLSTIGGLVTAIALLRLPRRQRAVLLAALVGFTLVQTANVLVWQRYYEPFVLLWLVLAGSVVVSDTLASRRRRYVQFIGLLALTAFQIAVTVYVLKQP